MTLRVFLIGLFIFLLPQLHGQEVKELLHNYAAVEFLVSKESFAKVRAIEGIYIDHGTHGDSIKMIATGEAYANFEDMGISHQIIETPFKKLRLMTYDEILKLKANSNCLPVMDYYPSYEAYEELMYSFQENYPQICKVINIGTLSSGRKILVAQISGEFNGEMLKPNFFYTATMHGDELLGYPLMIQLIDHLLCNYGMDSELTELVDGINIFINPLANPNGTYRGGNDTVDRSMRWNDNFVDLNRNFPDPDVGDNPDGRDYQEETLIFMNFADSIDIHMSSNLHGGVEVLNYPWDTYEERHADDDWFVRISRDYADSVQYYSFPGYFTDFNNGITNGYDWTEIKGGRQDYHTYFKRARETTLELSDEKRMDPDSIPAYWDYNRGALLNYLGEALFGLRGRVVDCETGVPLKAEVSIEGFDKLNSSVFSNEKNGFYFRFIDDGSYDFSFTAPDYESQTHTIDVVDKSTIKFDVQLCPEVMSSVGDKASEQLQLLVFAEYLEIKGLMHEKNQAYEIFDVSGSQIQKGKLVDKSIMLKTDFPSGIYVLRWQIDGHWQQQPFFYPY